LKRRSVLPNIAVTRTDEGVMFVADRVGWKDVALMLYLVAGSAFNIYAYLVGQLDEARQILAVLYAVLGVLVVITLEQHYRQRKRMRGASMTVRPWPIRLGDEVKAVFRVAPAFPLSAKLECVEHVVSGGGKFQKTNTATMYMLQLADSEWTFVIPDHLPPSLDVKHNRVIWRIVTMVTAGDAEVPVEFELLVIPEVSG